MKLKILIAVAITACLSALAVAGCGEGSPNGGNPEVDCVVSETGERIVPHTSGLSCLKARAILYVLPAEIGRPQKIKTGAGIWFCSGYPPSKYPLEVRCHQGSRYFTIEGMD